ncbi:MAG: 3-methyladenine DNA glycosylase [Pycnora praestabilis]|nr:MAG: 3-methyladenine DNA glycosylase [Pycnora praestabilis]
MIKSQTPVKTAKQEKSKVINGVTKARRPAPVVSAAAVALSTEFTPSTPKRKQDETAASSLTPSTPTPSMVGILSIPYSTGDIDDAAPPSLADRPAEPHRTNAPLKTPGGSRVVAYSNESVNSSPSKTGVPRPSTTTCHILEEACNHLIKTDPRLKSVIDKHHCRIFSPEGLSEDIDPFRSLCSGIMAQQVSGAAAKSIKNKFVALFNQEIRSNEAGQACTFPTPSQVAACDLATLRTAGLSGRKAEYIKGLAEKFTSGELSANMLITASDEEVMEKLIAVRGLGRWSVEMFACFALKRLDVFSTGDLGVQRGMAALMGRDVNKLKAKGGKWKYMSEKDMLEHSEKFAPYRGHSKMR